MSGRPAADSGMGQETVSFLETVPLERFPEVMCPWPRAVPSGLGSAIAPCVGFGPCAHGHPCFKDP